MFFSIYFGNAKIIFIFIVNKTKIIDKYKTFLSLISKYINNSKFVKFYYIVVIYLIQNPNPDQNLIKANFKIKKGLSCFFSESFEH